MEYNTKTNDEIGYKALTDVIPPRISIQSYFLWKKCFTLDSITTVLR